MPQPVPMQAVIVLLAFVLVLGGVAERVVADERPPNIIFIMADDLGYGDVGAFGQETIRTPRLDAMAAQGMTFTDFYAGSTVCAPSRSVLVTGQHTGRTLIRGNTPAEGGVEGIGRGSRRLPLREEDTTVADLLREAGYATGIVGKWGLGEPGTTGTPNRQGFDYWFGLLNQARAHSHFPEFVWRNDDRYELPGNWDGARGQFAHDLFTAEAMHFIRRHADEPFFLYLPYTLPHAELWAPERFMEMYRGQFDETPFGGRGFYAPQAEPITAYAAMVSVLDRDVGAILDLLESLDIAEDTLVIFTSDNGPHAEGGYDPAALHSSGPLQGAKRDLYEGGIRVPTIAWWPGTVEAGAVSEHVADFADFLPTATDLAGAATPDQIDGVSFAPTLLGEHERQDERPLYWEFHERGFQQAGRKGHWKAVRLGPDEPIELYDLADDLAEQHDLADAHPEVVAWFESFFVETREPSRYWPAPVDATDDRP